MFYTYFGMSYAHGAIIEWTMLFRYLHTYIIIKKINCSSLTLILLLVKVCAKRLCACVVCIRLKKYDYYYYTIYLSYTQLIDYRYYENMSLKTLYEYYY